jgi:integrase/recombinase XerD
MSADVLSLVMGRLPAGNELLETWAWHQSAAGHTQRTVSQRVEFIWTLTTRAGRDDPAQLDSNDLIRYLSRDLSPWSKRTYFMHARAWFRWLHEQGIRDVDETAKLPVPKAPRVYPRPMTTPNLLRAVEGAPERPRTFLILAAYAGLRACEIAAISGVDVTVDSVTVRGKGGTLAMIPTHPRVWALAAGRPDGYWFPGSDHGHILAHTPSGTVTKYLAREGIPGSLHKARHWYGTNVLRSSGGNLRVAQELLRHASPATTAGYTFVEDYERSAAIAALPDFLSGAA